MDNTAALSQLEELAHALGLQIRYECLEGDAAFSSGGLCRIRDKHIIIVDERTSTKEKVLTLARVLRRFDLSRIFMRPALRDLLEGCGEEDRFSVHE
jgi:hypothetical protein